MSADAFLTPLRSRIRSWLGPRVPELGDVLVASNQYGSYAIPAEAMHRRPVRIVARGGVYEPRTIEFIRNRCGDRDVVHAGAFFGDFLPGIAAALAPGARLWAFEPNPRSLECARQTSLLNGLVNVSLEHAALSKRPGALRLRTRGLLGRALGGACRLVAEGDEAAVPVPAVALDDVIPEDRSIGIVQLDLEGHEKPALLGARKTIQRNEPVLILEAFDDVAWLRQTFPGLDYRHAGYLHRNAVFIAAR